MGIAQFSILLCVLVLLAMIFILLSFEEEKYKQEHPEEFDKDA